MIRDPFMYTFSGRFVNPLRVKPSDVCEIDVAHHLSLINRFNGATKRPIPVAQHVVYVSRLLDGTGYEWQGLHHDDGEAYVGDMTKWLKMSEPMKPFRDAEDIAQAACYEAAGIPPSEYAGYSGLMHPLVKEADKVMVRFEGLQGYGAVKWKIWTEHIGYPLLTEEELARIGKWAPWTAKQAEEAYLTRARMLRQAGLDGSISGPRTA